MSDLIHCKRCGEQYDWQAQPAPDNPSIYWVPNCPACGAKMTANPTDRTWLNIVGSDLDSEMEGYERDRERLHAHARLYHGRLVGMSVAEMLSLAKKMDERANIGGKRWGPTPGRDVAFQVRKQARRAQV